LEAALALSKALPVVAVRTSDASGFSDNPVKTAGRRFRRLCAGAPSPTRCQPVRWAAWRVSCLRRRSAVTIKNTTRRADRAPGRCRAGGGLLRGKDPTGRFFSTAWSPTRGHSTAVRLVTAVIHPLSW